MSTDDFAPVAIPELVAAQRKARVRAKARGLQADDAVLQAISDQVLERLPLLLIEPKQVLDLGCWGPEHLDALAKVYPNSDITGLKLGSAESTPASTPARPAESASPGPAAENAVGRGTAADTKARWLHRLISFGRRSAHKMVSGDPHSLPFSDGQFDLVVSNLCLPFCQKPNDVFAEVARVLKPGGAFLFSSLGPDTLVEYRQRWVPVDDYPHVYGLIDMHDLGDAMLKAGLADPVLDRDSLNLDYPSVEALENELQVFGLVNNAHGRRKGLMSVTSMSRVRSGMSRFTVGLELVHGHAWKTEFSPKRHSSNDEYRIPVSELKGSWKR